MPQSISRRRFVPAACLRMVIAAAGVTIASAAMAQQPPTAAQVGAIRSACQTDYGKQCHGVPPGGKAALECLQTHLGKVSARCRTAVAAATAPAAAPAHRRGIGGCGHADGAAADGRAGRRDPVGLPGRLRQAVPGYSARREGCARMPANASRKSVGAMPDRGGGRHRTGNGACGTGGGIGDCSHAHDAAADGRAGWRGPVGLRDRLWQAVSGRSARRKGRGRMSANAYRDGVAALPDRGGGGHRHRSAGAPPPGRTAHAHPICAIADGEFFAGRTGGGHSAGRCHDRDRTGRHGRPGCCARHGRA